LFWIKNNIFDDFHPELHGTISQGSSQYFHGDSEEYDDFSGGARRTIKKKIKRIFKKNFNKKKL
jgi:hypothetical protein